MHYDSDLIEHFSFYEKSVLPVILAEPTVLQKHYGYHGLLTHTKSVVFRGIDYCLSLSQDVKPVVHFMILQKILMGTMYLME